MFTLIRIDADPNIILQIILHSELFVFTYICSLIRQVVIVHDIYSYDVSDIDMHVDIIVYVHCMLLNLF